MITGGGITAGIDFGLDIVARLFGIDAAKRLQLAIDCHPRPRFNAGSPTRQDPKSQNQSQHQRGSISVNGITLGDSVKNLDAIRREVGMVFQHFNLFPHLTVKENCALPQILARGKRRRDAEEMAMHFLAKVRIPEQADKYPGQLSGGQQQRVAIARALCMTPKVMLFDEPTSALDPEMVKEVLDTMVTLAEEGMTMIVVTHEMGFARKVADRVVFMEAGEVIEVNEPNAFFDTPSHDSTRRFLANIMH